MSSCYHEFGPTPTPPTPTTVNVSFTMVSDTLPANIGIVSFKVMISSVILTSSTGTTSTLNLGGLNNGAGLIVDLARAQSDSIYLGTIAGVPSGTNASITVRFTGAELAFYNGTSAAITSLTPNCPVGAICVASFNTTAMPVITSSTAISASTGFGIDFNLANAITLTGTSLSVNLTNPGTANVISAFTLPRATNLASGQLDLIEDFTGVVTLSGTSATIASSTQAGRGSITAASSSTTVYDQDPSQTLCPGGTTSLSGCVANTQVASMDAILTSTGTFTIQEIEPLLATPVVDTVEGTVVSVTSPTQFSIIVSDIFPAATSSKVGSLNVGDPLTVNLGTIISGGFLVDTKGLAVGGALGNFQGATTAGAVRSGQTVAVHVNSFTAAAGTTAAIANNVDTVTLRWSRFISTLNTTTPLLFNIGAIPGYFLLPSFTFDVQTFGGTQGTEGVTNLDITSVGLTAAAPVAIRALYLQNTTNTQDPAFYAAKVRQH